VQRYPDTHDLKSLIIGGLGFGLATLTRNETGVFVAAAAAWLLFTEGFSWRHLAVSMLPLLMVALVFAPWIARNYSVFGELVLASTKGGGNFYQGNSPRTIEYMLSGVRCSISGKSVTARNRMSGSGLSGVSQLSRDNWQQVPFFIWSS
jgi:4-amino-4-deoxy-L-arabinose transferase-like glycosyltransferase